jgi:hypothetical protein
LKIMKRPLDVQGDCAADCFAELSNPIGELPSLSAIRSEALRILESKDCIASFGRKLAPSKVSLQERIMTASRKVPSPLRLEPDELEPGSFGKHAAINSELIMAEALGCLKDFRCQSAKEEKVGDQPTKGHLSFSMPVGCAMGSWIRCPSGVLVGDGDLFLGKCIMQSVSAELASNEVR